YQMRNTGKSHRVSEFKLRLDGLKLALVIRAPDAHRTNCPQGRLPQVIERQAARVGPAGLEPATSWFVAVNAFVDPPQLTTHKGCRRPATWTQSWTQAEPRQKDRTVGG